MLTLCWSTSALRHPLRHWQFHQYQQQILTDKNPETNSHNLIDMINCSKNIPDDCEGKR